MSKVKPIAAINASKTTLNQINIFSNFLNVHVDLLALENKTNFHVINKNIFFGNLYLEFLGRNPSLNRYKIKLNLQKNKQPMIIKVNNNSDEKKKESISLS